MDIETARNYCIAKKEVTEGCPFGDDVLVLKVAGKMFATLSLEATPARMNLKCEPERALELREKYDGTILPGYHMSKKHWNTLVLDYSLPDVLVYELIDHSYQLVVQGLKKADRERLL